MNRVNWLSLIIIVVILAAMVGFAYGFYNWVLPKQDRSVSVMVFMLVFCFFFFVAGLIAHSMYKSSRDLAVNQMGEIELAVFIAKCMQSHNAEFPSSDLKFYAQIDMKRMGVTQKNITAKKAS